jgi:hypothetical protein
MRKAIVTALTVLPLGIVGVAVPALAAGFDGDWTVRVITEKGNCDPIYTYDVRVSQGAILYPSYTSVTLHGTVSPQGAVKVAIRHFEEHADGTGQLTSRRGNGGWKGSGRVGTCSGRWEAHRR